MKSILIVEDELAIQEMLLLFLKQQGFQVLLASDYDSALLLLETQQLPDLILLDWMLPGGSGINLLKQIKAHKATESIPVIMLTARSEEDNKVIGLEAGAEDYMIKPFSLKELLARIKVVFRRNQNEQSALSTKTMNIEGICIDIDAHRVFINEESVQIGRMEYKLLVFLMTHMERVFSRSQLLDHVWGTDAYLDERTVDVVVGRLRKILEPTGHGKLLQTVRGEGYRFSCH
ncbi:phosphate regulon transcriptional regulator PhoB [Neisseria sp. Ec49-e6-T10]|uniref:phosphate regulon transcriptional regulator PhoB n=1 Tax=Neisseria sp. Ec49-e6-T10 TaxID=3140744 RepID=UPI003EB83F7B